MKTDKRRVRGVFAAIVADPYRKLVAIALAMGLWFFVNNQIVGTLPPRSVPLVPVASARTGERVLGNRLAVVLPMDRVVGKRFLDGDTPIDDVTIVLSGPRYRIDALENETLDLQVTAFATIDFGTRNDVEFTAADIRHGIQGVTLEMRPARVRLEVERIDTWPVKLSLDNVELQLSDDGGRLRRDTAEFTPDTATILGTAAALAQIRMPGPKPLRARLPKTAGTSRQVTAGVELAAPKELNLQLAETPSVTIQLRPETTVFEFELPLVIDDLALPANQRGLFQPERTTQFARIVAGGDLRSTLTSLGENGDKARQQTWANANLRLLVQIPSIEPTSGPEIVREARLLLLGPLQATVDRSECGLEEPVSVILKKRK